MRVILSWIGVIVLLLMLSFGGQALGLFNLKFWGVKYEDARREIFEETKSFKHSIIQDMYDLRLEYSKADSDNIRNNIRSIVNNRVVGMDLDYLPIELRNFLNEMNGEL